MSKQTRYYICQHRRNCRFGKVGKCFNAGKHLEQDHCRFDYCQKSKSIAAGNYLCVPYVRSKKERSKP